MSDYYTPSMEELREAWVTWSTSIGPQGTDDIAEYGRQFDRTMDEFGNEMYEDGFSEGVVYAGQPEYVEGPRSL